MLHRSQAWKLALGAAAGILHYPFSILNFSDISLKYPAHSGDRKRVDGQSLAVLPVQIVQHLECLQGTVRDAARSVSTCVKISRGVPVHEHVALVHDHHTLRLHGLVHVVGDEDDSDAILLIGARAQQP